MPVGTRRHAHRRRAPARRSSCRSSSISCGRRGPGTRPARTAQPTGLYLATDCIHWGMSACAMKTNDRNVMGTSTKLETAIMASSRRDSSAMTLERAPMAVPSSAAHTARAARPAMPPGSSPDFCATRPRANRTLAGSRTTLYPATRASPASGRDSVVRIFTVVDLPAPFGLSRPNTVPVSATRLRVSRARTSPR